MKQTIKTSRVAGQLEKMFRALNNRFFDGELPEVVISLKKTAGAYGHFTTGKVWKTGEERRYEINISSASLNQECAFLAGVLVHEMVHEYCAEHGIKDTSNNGVYHNKNFRHIAETHGLEVEHHPKYGWTITSPGLELLDFVEEQGWQDFQMVESLNPCRSKKYISPHPLVNKLSRHILALCGGAAIFHDLLTQGCGLYFFFSPAGVNLLTTSAGIKSKLLKAKGKRK